MKVEMTMEEYQELLKHKEELKKLRKEIKSNIDIVLHKNQDPMCTPGFYYKDIKVKKTLINILLKQIYKEKVKNIMSIEFREGKK